MTKTTITLEKAFYGDFCEWEHTITATISPMLEDQIAAAQKVIRENPFIRTVDVDVPCGFLSEDTEALLQEQCRYDVSHLSVYSTATAYSSGFVFCLQGKWDARIQAEYTVV
tara:strand:- start:8965 stop:9300 length:336 start_codon:yes stop_codon:yes gene_type:complete